MTPKVRRVSRAQARRLRNFRAAMCVLVMGLVLLTAGGFGLYVEINTANHTASGHVCAFTSYLGVMGTFGGSVFTLMGLAFMIFGDD